MTTVREQARDAAIKSVYFPDIKRNYPDTIVGCADAASDVWEPLLTAAHEEIVLLREIVASFVTNVSGDGKTVYLRQRNHGFLNYHDARKFQAIKHAVEAQG